MQWCAPYNQICEKCANMHHVQRLKGKKVAIIIDFSFEDMEVIIIHNAGRWRLNGPRAGRGASGLAPPAGGGSGHGPFFRAGSRGPRHGQRPCRRCILRCDGRAGDVSEDAARGGRYAYLAHTWRLWDLTRRSQVHTF